LFNPRKELADPGSQAAAFSASASPYTGRMAAPADQTYRENQK